MKKAFQYGNAEVLQVTTVEHPVPQRTEVLIRVKAAGLDYGQWHLMAGKPYAVRLATGLGKPNHRVLGTDVSGVVDMMNPSLYEGWAAVRSAKQRSAR